jgi:ATP sulfurylase
MKEDNGIEPVYASLHFYYDDPDSMRRFRECNQAADVKLALWAFDTELRRRWKYGKESEQGMTVAEVRSLLWETLNERGINLDDD